MAEALKLLNKKGWSTMPRFRCAVTGTPRSEACVSLHSHHCFPHAHRNAEIKTIHSADIRTLVINMRQAAPAAILMRVRDLETEKLERTCLE